MRTIKKMSPRVLLSVIIVIMAFMITPAFSAPDIRFISSDEAIGGTVLPEPCVARLPAWELSLSEGAYSGFSVRRAREDCRNAFAKEVRDFTNEEKETLTRYATLIDGIADAEFPALKRIPWSFVVISDTTDFGVPASREHIILTRALIADMREWMDNQARLFFMGIEILVHERVRLLQIANPAPFERFFVENWGFQKISPLSIDDRQMRESGLHLLRTPTVEWVFKTSPRGREFFMPALLLRDTGGGNGGVVQRAAVMMDSTSRGFFPRRGRRLPIEYKDLRFVTQYRRKFPMSDYDYHPSELSADLLAKYLVTKYVSARYGTPARTADYSQIDVLMRLINESG